MLRIHQRGRSGRVQFVDPTSAQHAICKDRFISPGVTDPPISDASSSRITRRSQMPLRQSAIATLRVKDRGG